MKILLQLRANTARIISELIFALCPVCERLDLGLVQQHSGIVHASGDFSESRGCQLQSPCRYVLFVLSSTRIRFIPPLLFQRYLEDLALGGTHDTIAGRRGVPACLISTLTHSG
jgi:hypothetical protein